MASEATGFAGRPLLDKYQLGDSLPCIILAILLCKAMVGEKLDKTELLTLVLEIVGTNNKGKKHKAASLLVW
jgi:hypothetical protein